MSIIIGREEEREKLDNLLNSNKSEFIAVYGRRRIGKTFLIRTHFKSKLLFQATGIANANLSEQLQNFHLALQKSDSKLSFKASDNWLNSFRQLEKLIENSQQKKKIIFIDELPWFDTPKSGFIKALEHFWNSFASARNDVILIGCGSAASWMLNKLINSKGGLHNRVSKRIKLKAFSLKECEDFLIHKKIKLDKYQIAKLYMALGGVPFYWDEIEKGKSADQNIQRICFSDSGLLKGEFKNLFASLFSSYEKHEKIIYALAKKTKGLNRTEIIKETKLPNAGSTTRILNELEESGFIRKYTPFGKKLRQSIYQLIDLYSFFYIKFIKNKDQFSENYWINSVDSPKHLAWQGFTFEQICLLHTKQIKFKLGIHGIESSNYSWRTNKAENNAQIDLIIDRKDNVINICEAKFSTSEFVITKQYAKKLQNKISAFKEESKTKKTIFLTMISTYGLKSNQYSIAIVQNDIKLSDLFI